jgi:excinuclease UvrABC ATPase subunit
MCPNCHGLGKQIKIDLDLFLDKEKSIQDGAITHPHYKPGGFLWKELVTLNVVDSQKPLKNFSEEELNLLLYSEPFTVKDAKQKLSYNRNFEGIVRKLENAVTLRADDEADDDEKNAYTKYFNYKPCEHCGGSRLNERARGSKIKGLSMGDVCRMELADLRLFLTDLDDEISS